MTDLLCLSIDQPYASLIMTGQKRFETRPAPLNGNMRPDGVRGLPGCRVNRGDRIGIVSTARPVRLISTELLTAGWTPGSTPQPWTWDDEAADLDKRGCCCRSGMCDDPRHLSPGEYQRDLEAHVAIAGVTQGVYPGPDGRIWDGHHRIVAAIRQGVAEVPIEDGAFPLGRLLGTAVVARQYPITDGTETGDHDPHIFSFDDPDDLDLLLCYGGHGGGVDISDQLPYGNWTPGGWAIELTDPEPTTERCPNPKCDNGYMWTWDDTDPKGWHIIPSRWERCAHCEGTGRCEPVPVTGRQGVFRWDGTRKDPAAR